MKDRFHKNRHRIWLSNTWSRYWYVTKFFKTDYEKIGFCAAIVSLFWSLLRLKFASSQALPNTPFIFKLPLDYGGWFFSYLLLGFGLFKLTVDLKSWTRTQLGGKRPDEKFHLSISNFQSSKTEFLSESDTGGSQLVRLEDFVADRVQDNGYLYITVKFGETLNHMAYSKDSEAHFVQNKIVEFDWQFYRSAAAKKIERGILDNSNSRVELRVALEIDSKVKTADLVNFVNGYKVSLRKLNFDNNRVIATCGRTSYFTSSLTNDMFCKQMLSNNSIDTLKWDFRKHYPATQFGNDGFFKINKLSDSHDVSNHVGSVVLAVSSDNFPILCRQGKNANINANKLVASGSGSLEWGDLKRAIEFAGEQDFTFDKFVRFGMARELFEECGLVDQHRITAAEFDKIWLFSQKIKLLSYYRDLNRGGLPIFIGFAKLEHTYQEIVVSKKSREVKVLALDGAKKIITSADQMQKFLVENYIVADNKVSDQILLITKLLETDVAQQVFNRIYKTV